MSEKWPGDDEENPIAKQWIEGMTEPTVDDAEKTEEDEALKEKEIIAGADADVLEALVSLRPQVTNEKVNYFFVARLPWIYCQKYVNFKYIIKMVTTATQSTKVLLI